MMATIPYFILLMSAVLVTGTESGILGVLDGLKSTVAKEVAAVAQPVENIVMGTLSSQCELIKKMMGMDYNQMDNKDEPDVEKLTLEFRDGDNRIKFLLTNASSEILACSSYNTTSNLTIFIHGFTDNPNKDNFINLNAAYNKIGDRNVMALDGSSLIGWLYVRSTTYVRFIGEKLGQVLAGLVANGLDPEKIHIIGHSLGAHIAGFAGKTFAEKTGKLLGRISGLDPAGPCFMNTNDSLRLNSATAAFVDVIHTDSGFYGLPEACGHVDFYPNGGNKQPSCVMPGSSHSRVVDLFVVSITDSTAFPAKKCSSWNQFKKGQCEDEISYMGLPCNSTTRGQFYLQTDGDQPYSIGYNGTTYSDNEAMVDKVLSITQ